MAALDERLVVAEPAEMQEPTAEAESARRERRSRLAIGGIIVAVIGFVAVISVETATSSSSSPRPAPTNQGNAVPSSSSSKLVRPQFSYHPLTKAMMGASTPTPVADDDTVMHHSVHMDLSLDQHQTHLHYEADIKKDVLSVDQNPSALAVECNATHLNIVFNSTEAAASFSAAIHPHSTLLPVLPEWGCHHQGIVRQAATVVALNSSVVHVETANASLTHVIKNIHLAYNGTRAPVSKYRRFDDDWDDDRRDRRDWFSDLIGDITGVWNTVTSDFNTALEDIQNIESVIGEAATVLETGNFSYDKTPWEKQISKSVPCGSGEIGDLTTCSWGYDAQLEFTLDIVNYELTNVELQMSGDANAGIATSGQPITKSWSGSQTLPGFDETLFATTFMIGPVPIPVALHGKMNNVFNWDVTGSLNLNGEIKAQGQLDVGVQYSPDTDLVPIFTHDISGTAAFNYATASLTTTGTISLQTQLVLTALYACTLSTNIAVTPVISATGTETIEGAAATFNDAGGPSDFTVQRIPPTSPNYGSSCTPTATSTSVDIPSVHIVATCGVDVTAAAKIDLEVDSHTIFDHTWPIGGSGYHNQFPLGQWCIHPNVQN